MNKRFTWLFACLCSILILNTGIAGNKNWKSGITGYWTNADNWIEGSIPAANDDVYITNGVNAILSEASSNLNSITIDKTLTFTNWNSILTASRVTILPTGVITLPAAFTNDQMSNNVYIVCSNLFIDTGGKIDADFKGWAGADDAAQTTSGNGPGKGGWTGTPSTYAGGGGYGGRGGDVAAAGGRGFVGGGTYGSETAPLDPGSGGGIYYVSGTAGAGGGAVRIVASGTVTVNGTISASGKVGTSAGGAGGSGGGVYITCNLFAGTNGAVTADGGNASTYATGGGGGRIAVAYTNITNPKPRVRFSVKSGSGDNGVGDLGTLHFTDASILDGTWFPHSGRPMIPGFSAWSPASLIVTNGVFRFPQGGFHLAVTNDLTVQGSATRLEIGGTDFTALQTNYASGTTSAPLVEIGGNLVVTNGGTFCVYAAATNGSPVSYGARVVVAGLVFVASNSFLFPYSDCTNGGSVFFDAGDVTVAAAGSINADGKGFAGAMYYTGAGFGTGKGSATAGAGYGGKGGDGASPATPGGVAYGSSNAPTVAGSGGGSQYSGHAGGAGGGLVWLKVGRTATIDGIITADGIDAISTGAGGGSGGGIYIDCMWFRGTGGQISADGGLGGSVYGGGGGGGRIAIRRPPGRDTCTATYSAIGGLGYAGGRPDSNGATGTVVLIDGPGLKGSMIKIE